MTLLSYSRLIKNYLKNIIGDHIPLFIETTSDKDQERQKRFKGGLDINYKLDSFN